MESTFTKSDTNAAKGVAVFLLLIHHLFLDYPETIAKIFNQFLPLLIGSCAKVCVAIFIILSGYGLTKSTEKPTGLKKFYLKRLVRIYIDYWFIWAVFVPVGMLFFGRTLSVAYGSNSFLKLILNFSGMHKFLGVTGYNATWWFVSLIIALYLLFPLIKTLLNKYGLYFLIFTGCFYFAPASCNSNQRTFFLLFG